MTQDLNTNWQFSLGVEALRRSEAQRKAREDRMRNALEILEWLETADTESQRALVMRVKATAREGLGRE